MRTIGLIELNSIAQGILTADCMIKAAEVKLVFAKPVCPGKFMILIHGDVGAVKTSVAAGEELGAGFVVDRLIIPNVHDQLITAINASAEPSAVAALGVMEFFSIASAIVAADAAAKSADVKLMEVRLGMGIGGKSFVTLTGDVSAVQSAVNAGLADAREKGLVISSCVIPSPSPDLYYSLI